MITWLVQLFFALGILFALMGNIGCLVFPDVYTRLQASATCSTTSVVSFFIAAILSSGVSLISGKIVVLMLFFLISSPVSSHIIAQYAWKRGIVPWRHYTRRGKRQ
jgi:multicomponent Na+:H+ antiporter subunit G